MTSNPEISTKSGSLSGTFLRSFNIKQNNKEKWNIVFHQLYNTVQKYIYGINVKKNKTVLLTWIKDAFI
jgi:hypothetical protein